MSIAFGSNKLIVAGDMSATITSDAVNLAKKEGFSVHAIYTGSPVGTLTLQASIDGVTWNTIANSSTAISSSGDTMWNINQANYLEMRVVYTFSSGTGTLNVFFSTKEDV